MKIEEREKQIELMLAEAAGVASRARDHITRPEHLLYVLSGTEEGRRTFEQMGGHPRRLRSFLTDCLFSQAGQVRLSASSMTYDRSLVGMVERPCREARIQVRPVSFKEIIREMITHRNESAVLSAAFEAGGLAMIDNESPHAQAATQAPIVMPPRPGDPALWEEENQEPFRPDEIFGSAMRLRDEGAPGHNAGFPPATHPSNAMASHDTAPNATEKACEHTRAAKSAMRNLSRAAASGQIDPVIGREREIEGMIDVLSRRSKRNVLLHGDPGVGKTALAEGLAVRLLEDDVPKALQGRPVYEVSVSGLVAGARFRGDFEMRMNKLIEIASQSKAILFIDEIHMMMGAGAHGDRNGMDVANILKPAMARGSISVIGATTSAEMQVLRADAALMRRFQPMPVREPSAAETREIIDSAVGSYTLHHAVLFPDPVLDAVVDLAARFLPQRRFPDKAFDLIDTAAVVAQRRGADEASLDDVRMAVTRLGGPELGRISPERSARLMALEANLNGRVFGQREAAGLIAAAFRLSAFGLQSAGVASCTLFNGDTGVGKSEMAQAMAEGLGLPFVSISMSDYVEKHSVARLIGAPPGYVGYKEEGLLVSAAEQHEEFVLLLDEIDKAHPDVFDILLQVLDKGVLRSAGGREVSFRRVHLVLAANLGVVEADRPTIGFARQRNGAEEMKEAVEKAFRKEFLARIQNVVQFRQLDREDLARIADVQIARIVRNLADRGLEVSVDPDVPDLIAGAAMQDKFGGRSIAAHVKRLVADPLVQMALNRPDAPAFLLSGKNGAVEIELSSELVAA